MKTKCNSQSADVIPRIVTGMLLCSASILVASAGIFESVAGALDQQTTTLRPWINLTPTGGPPSQRELFATVYDAANNRMIIHGGGDLTGCLSDAWVLTNADGTEIDTPTWTKLLPATPLRRSLHAAVYDSQSNRMIVFGGQLVNGGPLFNDVWVLTNANGKGGVPEWIQLTPSGDLPDARIVSTAVYDPANNRMTIFGGISAQAILGDVWVLTNANGTEATAPKWIQLSPSGTPMPARSQHTAVYDLNSNRMTVFGGGGAALFGDVWVLTNANGLGGNSEWIELAPTGTPPSPRYGSTAVYDPPANRMIVYGGTNNSTSFGDTWVLTNANNTASETPTWIRSARNGKLPASRSQLGAVYSVANNRLTIFAGDNAPVCCNLLNDTWVLPDADAIGEIGICNPPPAGLVSWWSGDKAADDVQGVNNGTLLNGASFAKGMVGSGFLFNEIDQAVRIPNSPSLSLAQITADAWVYPTGNQNLFRHIIDKDNGTTAREYALSLQADGLFGVFVTVPSGLKVIEGTTIAQLNTWYHVALTHDGLNLRLYVNGIQEGVIEAPGDIVPTRMDVGIGGDSNCCVFFKGIIDEAQIFNRALTDEEILAIYQAGAPGQCKPEVFVQDISPYAIPKTGGNYKVGTTIQVVDTSGLPISDAIVRATLALPDNTTVNDTVTTDSAGTADYSIFSSALGKYVFRVDRVNKSGRQYSRESNVEIRDQITIR